MIDIIHLNYKQFFTEIFSKMFNTEGLLPEATVFGWSPNLIIFSILSNACICVGYLSLARQFTMVYRSKNEDGEIIIHSYTWILLILAFLCLMSLINHIVSIVVLFYPYFYLQQTVTMVIGISFILTAIIIQYSFKDK